MAGMVLDVVSAEFERLQARIAGRFVRSEPRARVREYVSGLVAGLERKNGWRRVRHAIGIPADGWDESIPSPNAARPPTRTR